MSLFCSLNKPQREEDDGIGLNPAVASICSFIITTSPAGAGSETSCHGAKAGFHPGQSPLYCRAAQKDKQPGVGSWRTQRTHSETGRKCKLHIERPFGLGMEPTTFLLWGNSTNHFSTLKLGWNRHVQHNQVIFWRCDVGWLLVSMCWTCDKLKTCPIIQHRKIAEISSSFVIENK